MASVALKLCNMQDRRQAKGSRGTKATVTVDHPKWWRSATSWDFESNLVNTCNFEDTLFASGDYSTLFTGINTNINDPVHVSSTTPSIESLELVSQRVVKLVKP